MSKCMFLVEEEHNHLQNPFKRNVSMTNFLLSLIFVRDVLRSHRFIIGSGATLNLDVILNPGLESLSCSKTIHIFIIPDLSQRIDCTNQS